jgi:methylenetetrahydrofolate reductase (NADPH)
MIVPSTRLSFEFFPPKSFEGMQDLLVVAEQLKAHSPEFFSVTFGAGGSTRDRTIETVNTLKEKIGVPVAPHISCIGYDKNELANILDEYKLMGVKRIVVLRGDLPSGMVSSGDFELASEFVKFIRVMTGDHFIIEVAAYPEYHPQAKSALEDIINLKDKFEAGANCAITQYFFNTDAYFYFMDECVKYDINMPIIPGIMPIMQFSKLVRFSELCGAEVPRWLYKRLEAYGNDIQSVQAFGFDVVSRMCERLLAGGAPGLHFYTLNQGDMCTRLLRQFSIKQMVEVPSRNARD